MPTQVAFLRAINVGGTKVIRMETLRVLCSAFGLENVRTYIQSGNVIFDARVTTTLEAGLERHLEQALGYHVEVFLRSMAELETIAKHPPFELQGDETLHVTFLGAKPPWAVAEKLKQHNSTADEFAVIGREVYNLRHDRERSVFSNQFIEKFFGKSTTRNLTTLRKIVEQFSFQERK